MLCYRNRIRWPSAPLTLEGLQSRMAVGSGKGPMGNDHPRFVDPPLELCVLAQLFRRQERNWDCNRRSIMVADAVRLFIGSTLCLSSPWMLLFYHFRSCLPYPYWLVGHKKWYHSYRREVIPRKRKEELTTTKGIVDCVTTRRTKWKWQVGVLSLHVWRRRPRDGQEGKQAFSTVWCRWILINFSSLRRPISP